MHLPRLYAIADIDALDRHHIPLPTFASGLASAGVQLVQLRNKSGIPNHILAQAAILREHLPNALLIMNDRVDLALLAGFNGVHLGQQDLALSDARKVFSQGFAGVSTHTPAQVLEANQSQAAYLAIGPVFATTSKPDAAETVGLEGVRAARALTRKPLVAIGGITRQNCLRVLAAGADSVAVISGLIPAPGETVAGLCRDWISILSQP